MAKKMVKKSPAAVQAPKPDAEVARQIVADVEARLKANQTVDTMPEGAQGGLFGKGGGFGKALPDLVNVLLKVTMMAGDGVIGPGDAAEIGTMAFDLISRILAGRRQAKIAGAPEPMMGA